MENQIKRKDIGILLKFINKRIQADLNRELEKYDLTLVQNEILIYIHCHSKNRDVCQKDIEAFLNSTNPTVTGLLKRLETKGLVQRSTAVNDARYKKLELTAKGNEVVEKTLGLGPEMIERKLCKKLTAVEVEQLREILELVLEGLQE